MAFFLVFAALQVVANEPAKQTSTASDPLEKWHANPPKTVSADPTVTVDGAPSIRFRREKSDANRFSVITQSLPIEFDGERIELRGKLRLRDVDGTVGLWLREDGPTGVLQLENMHSQHLSGSKDWADYSVSLPIDPKASKLFYGVLLEGTGTAWSNQPQLFVDGKPIADVPHVERKKSILETDTEFANGSGIHIDTLSNVQSDNLATLGEVWGFLKYFHPAVTSGTKQWDFELFRVMPKVIGATSRDAANRVLLDWIDSLGTVPPCSPCATPDTKAQMHTPIEWMHDTAKLGKPLSDALVHIYENRIAQQQFYVSLGAANKNPFFDNEMMYDKITFPDSGYALLAGYRFWSIIQYWYPYRDLVAGDWAQALRDSIPELASANDDTAFDRAMLKLIARVQDTHANLWSSLDSRPPVGDCQVPIAVRFIGDKAVIGEVRKDVAEKSDIRRGDVIDKLDGVAVSELVKEWLPYYAASNQPTRLRDIGRSMLRGACSTAHLQIDRAGKSLKVDAQRIQLSYAEQALGATHDLPGDTFRLLTPDIAYLKLSSLKIADVPGFITQASQTKGLIVDIRNYPAQFVVLTLGALLVEEPTPFAQFSSGDLSNPGEFTRRDTVTLKPRMPHYGGKVMILVDETSQSQAEYTAMALRSSPRAKVIGSTTAGADGNISEIPLPGARSAAISGLGVFYPDGRRTQQIGIIPDIVVKPTIAGIRDGKDEVLERAISEIGK